MHLIDLRRILKARWRMIVAVTCALVVAAWFVLPDTLARSGSVLGARATATLVAEKGDGGQATSKDFNTLGIVASEGDVPTQVATKLGTTVPDLASRVKITSAPATQSLTIVALDRTRSGASKTADTYAETVVAVLTSKVRLAQSSARTALTQQVRQLESTKGQLDEQVKVDPNAKPELDAAIKELNAQRAKLNELNAEPPADPGLRSVGPSTAQVVATGKGAERLLRKPVRLGLAALLGILGSLGAFFLLDRLDSTLRTKEAVELAYAFPVLAEVPPRRGGRTHRLPGLSQTELNSAYVESHRILRTAILSSAPAGLVADPTPPCVIVVTSAEPAEGKTSTAANLASSFAEAGSDTLVVGLDLRHSDLSALIPGGQSSEEIHLPTTRGCEDSVEVSIRDSEIRGLRVATVVPPLGPPAVVLPTVAAWLRELHGHVDVIVVDTPPLLVCNDASEVIPYADTVVVTCRAGRTTIEATERATEVLHRLHAPVCGVVLVGADVRASVRDVAAYGQATRPPRPAPDDSASADRLRRPSPVQAPTPLHPHTLAGAAQSLATAGPPAPSQEQPPRPGAEEGELPGLPQAAVTRPRPSVAAAWQPAPPSGGRTAARRTASRALERLAGRRKLRS